MPDYRADMAEITRKNTEEKQKLQNQKILDLNRFWRRKVKIEVLKPTSFDICDPQNIQQVVGTVAGFDRKAGSCTLDYAEPKSLKSFPVSLIISIDRA